MNKKYLNKFVKKKKENFELLQEIESTRKELNNLIGTEGVKSEIVLELSRDLDRMLLEYQDKVIKE